MSTDILVATQMPSWQMTLSLLAADSVSTRPEVKGKRITNQTRSWGILERRFRLLDRFPKLTTASYEVSLQAGPP
jgi:hypothetical protein